MTDTEAPPELDYDFTLVMKRIRMECPDMAESLVYSLGRLRYMMEAMTPDEKARRQGMFEHHERSLLESKRMEAERNPLTKGLRKTNEFEAAWDSVRQRIRGGELVGNAKRSALVGVIFDALDVGRGDCDEALSLAVVEKAFRLHGAAVVRDTVLSLLKSGDYGNAAMKLFGVRADAVARLHDSKE